MQSETLEAATLAPTDADQRAPDAMPAGVIRVLPLGLLSALLGFGVGLCAAGFGIAVMGSNGLIPYLMGVGGFIAGATFPYILAALIPRCTLLDPRSQMKLREPNVARQHSH